MNPDDPYGENDPATRAALDRKDRREACEQIKRVLRARVRAGLIGGQSATQYAALVLERPVTFLEDLTPEELNVVIGKLNGETR